MWREFGYPSSFPAWSPPAMVSLLLRETAPEHARLPVTVVDAAEADKPSPRGVLVVDMRKLRLREKGERPAVPKVRALDR